MSKIIHIITNDGSPIGVTEKSISGEDGSYGVGGAELALLTLCRGWHERGYDVTLYNSPSVGDGSVFKQKGIDEFRPEEDRDVVIVFRSPNERLKKNTKGLKVWWSCDQYTIGDFSSLSKKVDKIVTISDHHSEHFKNVYGIVDTTVIDLPVRIWEYDLDTKKSPYKCIFNSIPDRGLMQLASAWDRIVKRLPEATLVVTSDWRLWDRRLSPELTMKYQMKLARLPNVSYLGAISRKELIYHELTSQMHLYPCIYEELFCISVAETQVTGAYPVTSDCGAVKTTNMGKIFPGNADDVNWKNVFVDYVVDLLKDQDRLEKLSKEVQQKAVERFSLDRILKEWDEKVFEDEQ